MRKPKKINKVLARQAESIARGKKMLKYYDRMTAKGYSSAFIVRQLSEKYDLSVQSVYKHVYGKFRARNLEALRRE